MTCGSAIAHNDESYHDENTWGQVQKNVPIAWDILIYFITAIYSSSNSCEYFCHINLSLLFIFFSSTRYVP